MTAVCPWDGPEEAQQPSKSYSSTLHSLSDADLREEHERWAKTQRRRQKELQHQEVVEEFNGVMPERDYDDRDAPSAFSVLWGSKTPKSTDSKKPKRPFFASWKKAKRDEKSKEWKKIP